MPKRRKGFDMDRYHREMAEDTAPSPVNQPRPQLSYMSTWPHDYVCSERTVDINLAQHPSYEPRILRIWFDGKSPEWTPDKLQALSDSIRKNRGWDNVRPEVILDWVATLPDVNAVQVQEPGNNCRIGVMAYTVQFSERDYVLTVIDEYMAGARLPIVNNVHVEKKE